MNSGACLVGGFEEGGYNPKQVPCDPARQRRWVGPKRNIRCRGGFERERRRTAEVVRSNVRDQQRGDTVSPEDDAGRGGQR